MTSYLLSSLANKYRGRWPVLLTEHPHCWLVWEPGVWRPPPKQGGTMTAIHLQTPSPVGGEALALGLQPRPSNPGQVTVGRAASCDMEINDATLSQTHLLLMESAPGSWTVRDAGSKNGSWIDGILLAPGVPRILNSGDRLQAAQVCLTFLDPSGLIERLKCFTPTPAGGHRVPTPL